MSSWAWIVLMLVVWVLLALVVGRVVGAVVKRRDAQHAADDAHNRISPTAGDDLPDP